MCGRYRLSRRKQIIEEYFETANWQDDWTPRYNVAPTQPVPVIRQHPTEPVRQLSLMRWGLIPSWSKDPSAAARMINARSETASTLPAFRDALKFRRCVIPADGFYEWSRAEKTKQPFCFEVRDGELFAFAGIWDRWQGGGIAVETCSILTTTPNAVTSAVHDRMPVILDPDNYDLWLDPGMRDVDSVSNLLRPYPAPLMRCYPVSTRINHVANDDEECSRRVELAEIQTTMFSRKRTAEPVEVVCSWHVEITVVFLNRHLQYCCRSDLQPRTEPFEAGDKRSSGSLCFIKTDRDNQDWWDSRLGSGNQQCGLGCEHGT
jgi:putative SOS response-associated peptidase YedK